eukprot:TRINITY_DN63241_c0_g1_i1.p1 TRINITY_DN63241_c0_g1~~TRINITY_DN63241_c0_g1_i1.p1  ORF type:complete len:187 (-),score=26.91 TRINITY_DN63241_c0_g1_i1:208-723(-)
MALLVQPYERDWNDMLNKELKLQDRFADAWTRTAGHGKLSDRILALKMNLAPELQYFRSGSDTLGEFYPWGPAAEAKTASVPPSRSSSLPGLSTSARHRRRSAGLRGIGADSRTSARSSRGGSESQGVRSRRTSVREQGAETSSSRTRRGERSLAAAARGLLSEPSAVSRS